MTQRVYSPTGVILPVLPFLLGLLSLLLSLLTVLPPPHLYLWVLSVPIKEWGHWLALLAVPLTAWAWAAGSPWGALLAAASAVIYLLPLLRALPVAARLPTDMETAFGVAPDKGQPLRWRDLFLGVRLPKLSQTTVTYADHGDGRPLRMAITRPNRPDPAPVVLVIHGGSWRSGDHRQLPALNRYLAGQGYVVSSIDYRLSPAHRFPAAADDVKAALCYIKEHAHTIGADPTRIVLLGRSAGGQLAVLTAYSVADPSIRGAISYYGPFDLAGGYSLPGWVLPTREILDGYLGPGGPGATPHTYRDASPLSFVGAHVPPTLMIQGAADVLVSPLHNVALSAKLRQVNRPHLVVNVPLATHASDACFNGPFGQISTYAVERFLHQVTKESEPLRLG